MLRIKLGNEPRLQVHKQVYFRQDGLATQLGKFVVIKNLVVWYQTDIVKVSVR